MSETNIFEAEQDRRARGIQEDLEARLEALREAERPQLPEGSWGSSLEAFMTAGAQEQEMKRQILQAFNVEPEVVSLGFDDVYQVSLEGIAQRERYLGRYRDWMRTR